jgi:iron complex outermembrane recepter protein
MKPKPQFRHYTLLLATRLALACLGGAAIPELAFAAEIASAEQTYQIPAGPLSAQLKQFAKQSGITLSIDEQALKGWNGPALQGRYAHQQGLNTLLANTGFQALAAANGHYQITTNSVALAPVTVTGEKMSRSMQETTTAITVLNSNDVDKGDISTVYAATARAPNVNANGSGGVNIRGVEGTGPGSGVYTFLSGARPRVSTSVDGATESWSGQQYVDFGMWDVGQVEIMRGPQSTTQGRNTIGGAIVVNTKDPSFSWEGAVRAGYENEAGRGLAAAMISGPLLENELAFRLAAEGIQGHSFINYPGSWPWDPSEVKRQNFRGKLLWTPSGLPDFSAKITVSQRNQKGEYLNRINGENSSDYSFSNLLGKYINTRYQDSSSTSANIDLEYKLSDSLSSHFLYSRGKYKASFEESGADRFTMNLDEKSNTAETRLVYDPAGGSFKGMAGLYFYNRHQDLLAVPLGGGFLGTDKVDTFAIFGESTIALNQKLDLIVGGRVERESQKRDVVGWPGRPWEAHVTTDIAETMLLPKLGLVYKTSPDHSFGLTVRQGYTPGGGSTDDKTNQFYEFGKEEVTTYELSSRSSLFDKRLTLNANLFYNSFKNYQALLNRRFINIPKGESYGLEVSADASVNSSLQLFASLGLLQSKVKESIANSPQIVGNQFGYAAPLTSSFGFKQQLDMGFYLSGDVNYTGEYYSDVSNNDQLKAGKYTVANLQVGYEKDAYAVRAYVKNLLNDNVIYRKYEQYNEASVGGPRTLGITLDYRF